MTETLAYISAQSVPNWRAEDFKAARQPIQTSPADFWEPAATPRKSNQGPAR
jgi:hypothetical protein